MSSPLPKYPPPRESPSGADNTAKRKAPCDSSSSSSDLTDNWAEKAAFGDIGRRARGCFPEWRKGGSRRLFSSDSSSGSFLHGSVTQSIRNIIKIPKNQKRRLSRCSPKDINAKLIEMLDDKLREMCSYMERKIEKTASGIPREKNKKSRVFKVLMPITFEDAPEMYGKNEDEFFDDVRRIVLTDRTSLEHNVLFSGIYSDRNSNYGPDIDYTESVHRGVFPNCAEPLPMQATITVMFKIKI